MKTESKKLYCSLDIETSGFDPLKDEILEVGFAFFEVTEKGIKITEEWTQVFKPKGEVPSKILGLTGISQEELNSAPKFVDYKEFIQEKLKDAIIVGHNVIFDIKFLQAQGIKFSGNIIDTLDLVQFILPTHHSYNLENLMHLFNVSHTDAHRALADSKAALSVLEKLLRIYSGFPEELKREIGILIEPFNFPFGELLEINLPLLGDLANQNKVLNKHVLSPLLEMEGLGSITTSNEQLDLKPNNIYNFPLGTNYINIVKNLANSGKKKVLMVLPKEQQVIELWKNAMVPAVFGSEYLIDEKKLEIFSKKKDLSLDEAKFLLKILVWKYTNWQSECVLDLNLSFFGGQFKSLLCGKKIKEQAKAALVCCDQKTFLQLSKDGVYKNRFVVIAGLNEFEQNISSNIGQKASWGTVIYLLRSIYNPELGSSDSIFKDAVMEGLTAADLFFGLVSALLQTDPPSFQYFKITPEIIYTEKYQKIKAAAENFCKKLLSLNETLNSDGIAGFIKNLENFFEIQENRVKWIELADKRCVFSSTPINIKELVKESLAPFKRVALVDSLGLEKIIAYFAKRLGVEDFEILHIIAGRKQKIKEPSHKQQKLDLFSKLKSSLSLPPKVKAISCTLQPQGLAAAELLKILQNKDSSLPAAVLFAGTAQVKDFYDNNYQILQKQAYILAQSASGGTNKIFHNFSIHNQSLLLASDKFILKFLTSSSNVQAVEKLAVKTLIIYHLPFEQFTHPYQEAVSTQFTNPFEEFSLPRALYNFHSVLQFFNTPSLEKIYICDGKLSKGYATAFKDYLRVIPNVVIS